MIASVVEHFLPKSEYSIMRMYLFIVGFVLFGDVVAQETQFSGVWQGMLIPANNDMNQADVIYLTIEEKDGKIEGKSRVERMDQSVFAIKTFFGTIEGNQLSFSEKHILSSSNDRNDPKCKLEVKLIYEESSAYLKGEFVSSDCKRSGGTLLLFRSNMSFNEDKKPTSTHQWKKRCVEDLKKGYPAPEIRAIERKNFVFQPIFFDHDEFEIHPEYFEYLNKMARVVDGHSDLRVRVTGHTDAVGSDNYNIGLSERRARAIKAYFLSRGITVDKLEIDFKGKHQPIDTNETPEGKQRNRRVDFEFI